MPLDPDGANDISSLSIYLHFPDVVCVTLSIVLLGHTGGGHGVSQLRGHLPRPPPGSLHRGLETDPEAVVTRGDDAPDLPNISATRRSILGLECTCTTK